MMSMKLAWVMVCPGQFLTEVVIYMYLEALSIGCGMPQCDFDARVHSVFQSAANLRLKKRGKLLTLVGFGEADLP
jgi:hypothetical protein